ncbi:MAG TPA: two-component regulator propeller domain-containing protein, partial [Ohtaekwangia sp.]
RVTCFHKDQAGFMWIGTENGLNRYDGFTFRIYRPGQQQYRLSHERINAITEDSEKRLWVATWNGLNVIDPATDSLIIFSPDEDAYRQKKTSLSSCLIWDIYIDKKKRVWLAPDARDLCYYDPATQEFSYFPWYQFVKSTVPEHKSNYKAIQKITPKSDHELWLGTTVGLFSFNIHTKSFRYHGGELATDCIALEYDSTHHTVYFSQEKIHVYDDQKNQLIEIDQNEGAPHLYHIHSSRLLPTLRGLWNVDTQLKLAYPVLFDSKNPFSLHHEHVSTVYHDNGVTWIGTSSGVGLHDTHMDVFPALKILPDTLTPEPGNIFYVHDDERNQKYYICSYNRNSLIILNKKTGEQQEHFRLDGKPLTKCSRVFEDSQNRLWILCDQYIFISDKDHQKFKALPFPQASGEYNFVDMMEDPSGNFWIASLKNGVYLYNPDQNSWKRLYDEKNDFFALRPTSLLADPSHNILWVGDFSFGIFKVDLKSGKNTYYGMDTRDPKALQSSLVNSLTMDKAGNMWFATTSGGVSRFDRTQNNFITYSMDTGLPENTVHSIQADVNGNLWLASSRGITCMKPTGEIIRHYDQNSGLSSVNFTTPFSTNSKGELMIGSGNLFLKFHPDSMKISSPDFPIVITSAQQHNSPMNTAVEGEYAYNQGEFTFQFSALTYSLPQQVTYFYKLEGYDDDWVNAGNSHIARYTNLSDRRYKFSVKAVDHNGKPSVNTASIVFVIHPPFWKQAWFLIFITLLAGSSLYIWIRNLQLKIRAQEILNKVATSLYNQNTIEDVFWTVAKACIDEFHFEDCVVYLVYEPRQVLIQKAAAGPKSLKLYQILNPIEIPIGRGIVGFVAKSGTAEIINNTTRDRRYIVDDQSRLSEIAVPIIVDGKVFGVIDSEHSAKNFYTRWHLRMLKEIASICAVKIGRYFVEEQIRSKVARDLHDDMGSTLSSIKIMSNIALEKNDPVTAQTYLKSIRQNANTMQESMSDMVWAINPENDTLEKVIFRMKEFAAEILEPLDIQYEFIEDGDFAHARMDLNMRKDFFLIFKEAVNNAAKYSQCKKLTIELVFYARGIILRIRDDGKGFDTTLSPTGNGLKNMNQRAKNIQATIQIESVPGEGTSILLKTPIT